MSMKPKGSDYTEITEEGVTMIGYRLIKLFRDQNLDGILIDSCRK